MSDRNVCRPRRGRAAARARHDAHDRLGHGAKVPRARLSRLTLEQRLERGAHRLAARRGNLEERLEAGEPVWDDDAATMRTLA